MIHEIRGPTRAELKIRGISAQRGCGGFRHDRASAYASCRLFPEGRLGQRGLWEQLAIRKDVFSGCLRGAEAKNPASGKGRGVQGILSRLTVAEKAEYTKFCSSAPSEDELSDWRRRLEGISREDIESFLTEQAVRKMGMDEEKVSGIFRRATRKRTRL
jgi:hypothetical protein